MNDGKTVLAAAALVSLLALPLAGWAQDMPEIVTVTSQEVPVSLTAYGVVHAGSEAVLSAKVLAQVTKMPVREGEPVRKGDLLVEMDRADLIAQRDVARAALESARAALKEAKAEFDRVRRLSEQGSATHRELERATSAHNQAAGAAAEAEARLKLVETQLGHTRITAPFDGRLVERLVEVGEMAAPGTSLVRVESTGDPEMWADVPQEEMGRVVLGGAATVAVDGVAQPLAARVARIVPAADPRSHTFTVKVALEPDPALERVYSGMFGGMQIPYGTAPALTVPASAVVRRAEVEGVYVLPPGAERTVFRLIRAGRRVGDRQVVLAGLEEGEQVVADAARAAVQRAEGERR